MNTLYRTIITLLLLIGVTACTTNLTTISAANDEDKDIGLGGTGMLADAEIGLGGTGILGEITGYGSIYVNGVEIEYDDTTTIAIDGKTGHQQLEIGDVVEVLTSDTSNHTRARVINLRHEVIGKVEATDPKTFSFTVLGQTVIQSLDKRTLPVVGTTVAVSGFRVDVQTIVSTRVTSAETDQTLLRTHAELPFSEKTTRWLMQTYVQNDKAIFQLNGTSQVFNIKSKTTGTLKDHLIIKVLQLYKSDTGADSLKFDHIIEPEDIHRGRQTLLPDQQPASQLLPGVMQGPIPGSIQKKIQPNARSNR